MATGIEMFVRVINLGMPEDPGDPEDPGVREGWNVCPRAGMAGEGWNGGRGGEASTVC